MNKLSIPPIRLVKNWELPNTFNSKPKKQTEIVNVCKACGGSGDTILNKFSDGHNKLEKIDCLLCKGSGYIVIKNGKIS